MKKITKTLLLLLFSLLIYVSFQFFTSSTSENKVKNEEISIETIQNSTIKITTSQGKHGNGWLLDKDNGLIMTAKHVVYNIENKKIEGFNQSAVEKEIICEVRNPRKIFSAFVIYVSKEYDVAVIKVAKKDKNNLSNVNDFSRFSDKIEVQQDVQFCAFHDDKFGSYKGYISSIPTQNHFYITGTRIDNGMSGTPVFGKYSYDIIGLITNRNEESGLVWKSNILSNIKYEIYNNKIHELKRIDLKLKEILPSEKTEFEEGNDYYLITYQNGKMLGEYRYLEYKRGKLKPKEGNELYINKSPGDVLTFHLYEEQSFIFDFLNPDDMMISWELFKKYPQEDGYYLGFTHKNGKILFEENK